MRDLTEDRSDRLGIQRRAVGLSRGSAPAPESLVEVAEERRDVGVGWVVVQDPVGDPFEGAVVTIDRIQTARHTARRRRCSPRSPRVPIQMLGVDPSHPFPPGLNPVLDRCIRDEHAVIAPQGPAGGAIG